MKKYNVGMVRERLSQALDEARRGEPVFIERSGVTYRLTVEQPAAPATASAPRMEILDPAIVRGNWTWQGTGGALRFRSRRGK